MADAKPSGVAAIVARRRADQAAAVEVARSYAATLDSLVPLIAAVVFGSYARGDFNTWSDIDLLVISDHLPAGGRERIDRLWEHRPGGLEPVGWTVAEHAERRRRRDPIAVEGDSVGIVVFGALPNEPR